VGGEPAAAAVWQRSTRPRIRPRAPGACDADSGQVAHGPCRGAHVVEQVEKGWRLGTGIWPAGWSPARPKDALQGAPGCKEKSGLVRRSPPRRRAAGVRSLRRHGQRCSHQRRDRGSATLPREQRGPGGGAQCAGGGAGQPATARTDGHSRQSVWSGLSLTSPGSGRPGREIRRAQKADDTAQEMWRCRFLAPSAGCPGRRKI
jgi:hypothetical protein